jgi:hypothetical protein
MREIQQAYDDTINQIASNPKIKTPEVTAKGDPFTYYDIGRAIGLRRALDILVNGSRNGATTEYERVKADIIAARALNEQRMSNIEWLRAGVRKHGHPGGA